MAKVTALLTLCAVSLIGAVALVPVRNPEHVAAKVNRVAGFYVFVYSSPLTAFDSMAVVKVPQKFTVEPLRVTV